jgi:hypothetical protein
VNDLDDYYNEDAIVCSDSDANDEWDNEENIK